MSKWSKQEDGNCKESDLSRLYDYLYSIKVIEIERSKKGLEQDEVLMLNNLTEGIVDAFYGHLVMKVLREKNKTRQMNYLKCLRLIFQF